MIGWDRKTTSIEQINRSKWQPTSSSSEWRFRSTNFSCKAIGAAIGPRFEGSGYWLLATGSWILLLRWKMTNFDGIFVISSAFVLTGISAGKSLNLVLMEFCANPILHSASGGLFNVSFCYVEESENSVKSEASLFRLEEMLALPLSEQTVPFHLVRSTHKKFTLNPTITIVISSSLNCVAQNTFCLCVFCFFKYSVLKRWRQTSFEAKRFGFVCWRNNVSGNIHFPIQKTQRAFSENSPFSENV